MTKQNTLLQDIIPEELTSTLAQTLSPVAPPKARASALKSRVMARIQGKKSFDLFSIKSGEGEWITLMPGIEKKILNEDRKNQVQSYLLKVAPGSSLPEHLHLGDEECFVLEGEFTLGEQHYSAGDYLFAPKGSTHKQATSETGSLVFLRSYEAFV